MNEQQLYYRQKLKFEIDASDLFDSLQTASEIVIVDTRKPEFYAQEHLPKAINLPHRSMNSTTCNELNPSKTYVCYCDGIGCNASTKGALQLSLLGFQVKELIGGLDWWKRDGYPTTTELSTDPEATSIRCGC